jgi:hypothetical protein
LQSQFQEIGLADWTRLEQWAIVLCFKSLLPDVIMNRIFLTLAVLANLGLFVAAGYGVLIAAPAVATNPAAESQQPSQTSSQSTETDQAAAISRTRHAISMHLLIAVGASLVVLMLHSIVLTYFMGTGRWIEETGRAYALDERFRAQNIRYKYRVIPGMVTCMTLVILTGAFGAQLDPAAAPSAWSTLHFLLALATVGLNLAVSVAEYFAIRDNGLLVASVVAEVKRIRKEQGLDN